jgi:hypothetical protein
VTGAQEEMEKAVIGERSCNKFEYLRNCRQRHKLKGILFSFRNACTLEFQIDLSICGTTTKGRKEGKWKGKRERGKEGGVWLYLLCVGIGDARTLGCSFS